MRIARNIAIAATLLGLVPKLAHAAPISLVCMTSGGYTYQIVIDPEVNDATIDGKIIRDGEPEGEFTNFVAVSSTRIQVGYIGPTGNRTVLYDIDRTTGQFVGMARQGNCELAPISPNKF